MIVVVVVVVVEEEERNNERKDDHQKNNTPPKKPSKYVGTRRQTPPATGRCQVHGLIWPIKAFFYDGRQVRHVVSESTRVEPVHHKRLHDWHRQSP